MFSLYFPDNFTRRDWRALVWLGGGVVGGDGGDDVPLPLLGVGRYQRTGLQPVDWEASGPGGALHLSSLSPDRESHNTCCSTQTDSKLGQGDSRGDNRRAEKVASVRQLLY